MKMTRRCLLQLKTTLEYLRNQKSKAWYITGKNLRAMLNELQEYEASLKDLQQFHALKDEKGNAILSKKDGRDIITPIDQLAFDSEIEKLLSEEIEIALHTIPLSQIIDESHPETLMNILFELSLIEEVVE